jgi:POT family proton-dependent oligopeptide transporter
MIPEINHALIEENKKLKLPKSIAYIVGNEIAEEAGYYGMSAILVVFMTQYLTNDLGSHFTESQAMIWYHNFIASGSIFMIVGAIMADVFWGKYKTIIIFSIIYCVGHLILAFFNSKIGLFCGLGLISLGASGISPCVVAHLGDQFNTKNKYLMTKGYSWFYLAINLGCAPIMLFTPFLLKIYGPRMAFLLPAILMIIATVIFYRGHKFYNKVEPIGSLQKYLYDLSKLRNSEAISMLMPIFLFIAFFDCLYTQIGSAWVLQAGKMDLEIDLGFIKFNPEAAQIQFISPILVLIMVPLFTNIIYPFLEGFTNVTNIRKMAAGFFFTAVAFAVIAIIQMSIDNGSKVSILWQFLGFFFITIAEILIIITCNEITYLHVSPSVKTLFSSFQLLSIGAGSFLTSIINFVIQDAHGGLIISHANYFWLFTVLILVVAIIFLFYMKRFKPRIYIQHLNKLPIILERYRAKLEEITDIILESGKENIVSIILSVSGSRKMVGSKIYHVNFLLVVNNQSKKNKKNLKINYSNDLSNNLIGEIEKKLFDAKIELNNFLDAGCQITFTSKALSEFNLLMENNQWEQNFLPSFFIYNSDEHLLSNFRKDEKNYHEFYIDSLRLLNFAKDLAKNHFLDPFYLGFATFCLHQATEGFYRASLLFIIGQRSDSHSLSELNRRLISESHLFADIFSINNEEQKVAFELLELAYTGFRYSSNYVINRAQVEYLIERIERLCQITKEVCEASVVVTASEYEEIFD